ncbi:MAG: response regulator transcription factor [Tepidiformaceae bacterium]
MPSSSNRRGRPPHPDILTPSEWQVLEGVRAGRTNQEIADQLGVTFHTVKFHISNMLAKLHLQDRQQLAAWRPAPVKEAPSRSWRALFPWGGLKVAGVTLVGSAAIVGVAAAAVLTIGGGNADPDPAAPPPATQRAAVPTVVSVPPTCAAVPPPIASSTPASVAPESSPDVEARILARGHAFSRMQFQVKLADPVPVATHVRAEGLSATVYGSDGPRPLPMRGPGAVSGGGEGVVIFTLDTDPIPEGTVTVAIEAVGFTFIRVPQGCYDGGILGSVTGVASIDSAPELAADLSDRVPPRVDTGFGWAYVIDGLDRIDNTVWVTYHVEGVIEGLLPDSSAQSPVNLLPFRGPLIRTEHIFVPQAASSVTVTFGAVRRRTDPSQSAETAPLESGDWTVTIPLD